MNVHQIFTTEITSIYHSYDATLSSINTFSAARGPSTQIVGHGKIMQEKILLVDSDFNLFLQLFPRYGFCMSFDQKSICSNSETHLDDRNFREITVLKFIFSEKATKFCKIFTFLLSYLSYVVPVKSKVQILQYFVAFSKYMNFRINVGVILALPANQHCQCGVIFLRNETCILGEPY